MSSLEHLPGEAIKFNGVLSHVLDKRPCVFMAMLIVLFAIV